MLVRFAKILLSVPLLLLLACSTSEPTPSPASTPAAATENAPTGTSGGGGGGNKPKGSETASDPETTPPVIHCSGAAGTFYALSAKRLAQVDEHPLCAYEGAVVLVVNGASACGYTPQYKPLQALYAKYNETQGKKFDVLAFPSDSFNQEKPDDKQVSEFCTNEYGITFPLFTIAPVIDDPSKNRVAQPVYKWIAAQPGMAAPVSWNFEKFLISKDGKVVKRWASGASPDEGGEIDLAIAAELAK